MKKEFLSAYFWEMCKEEERSLLKQYSGKFNLRVSPELDAEIAQQAAADGKSLNKYVADMLDQAIHCQ